MSRRFTDAAHRKAYDDWRAKPPEKMYGGLGKAYMQGWNAPDEKPGIVVQPRSLSYAIWCAGVDNARAARASGTWKPIDTAWTGPGRKRA